MAVGCFKVNYFEDAPAIITDTESITVTSSVPEGSAQITCDLVVTSNRSWGMNIVDLQGDPVDWIQASVADDMNLSGQTQEVSISLTFEPNWVVSPREAKLILTSAEYEKIIPIHQDAADVNLEIDTDQTVSSFGPYHEQTRVYFQTNADWTAAVAEGSTIADVRLSKTAGTSDDTYIDVTFGKPYAGGVKEAVIQFYVEGMAAPRTITLVQTGLILNLDFAQQPFTADLPTSKTSIVETTYSYPWYGSSYDFLLGENDIQYRAADKCILLAKSKTVVGLPAVEGLRLARVEMQSVATDKKYTISSDISGTVIEGGEMQKLPMEGVGSWTLTDTQADTRYYIYMSSSNSRIASISLIYE